MKNLIILSLAIFAICHIAVAQGKGQKVKDKKEVIETEQVRDTTRQVKQKKTGEEIEKVRGQGQQVKRNAEDETRA